MRLLNRYIFNSVAGTTALVLVVLLSLSGFMSFIGQLGDVGEGDFTMFHAVNYALLKLPGMAAGLMPVSALLGSLLGLGAMAASSELIVMRSAGISINRLARSVAMTGLALALFGGVIGEFIAPQMDLYARQMKAVAKSGGADITGSDAWLRSGDTIVNVRSSIDGTDYGGVYTYRFVMPGQLAGIGRGESVEYENGWQLQNFRESLLGDEAVTIGTQFDRKKLEKLRDLLAITEVKESSLTGQELRSYIDYLESNGLDADRYVIAFWNRISSMAGIIVMCVLALPFVTGSLRSAGAGARIVIGALIGVGYFLLSRTLTDSVTVFNLSPVFVAWLPTLILAAVAWAGMQRIR